MYHRVSSVVFLAALALNGRLVAEEVPEEGARVRYRTPSTTQQCCGIDALYVSLRAGDLAAVSLVDLEQELPTGPRGVSVEAIQASCRKHGVTVTAVRTDLATLRGLANPVMLHVNGNHFIAFLGTDKGRLLVFDSTAGLFDCSSEWFTRYYKWDGVALILGPPPPSVALAIYGPPLAAVAFGLACLWLFFRLRRQPKGLPRVPVPV